MKYHYNINFPALTLTTPGVYSYTIKELTPSDEKWKTDSRVYRVVVKVTDNEDGTLMARINYPDGIPKFDNTYMPPPPPCNPCKYFNCLPFPMFWFAPPQKPEFKELLRSSPHIYDQWDNFLKCWHDEHCENKCNCCQCRNSDC